MKKQVLLIAAFGLLLWAGCKKKAEEAPAPAPTPQVAVEQKNMTLLNKFTGTNCYYCGEWGWPMFANLIDAHQNDAVCVGTYSQNSFAVNYITQIATDWDKRLPVTVGYPTFAANLKDSWKNSNGSTASTTTDMNNNLEAAISAHNAAPVVVNAGHQFTINGNNLDVKTSVKFFQPASGEYYLGVYVTEDGVIGNQSGPNGGPNASHHKVLRAGNASFGEVISTGDVTANQFFDKNITIALDPSWNKANLEVFTVIWKKNGATFDFVNAHK